jgi:acetyl-CoA/propionyl-CoA carboxylase biotin carboxyl carrier protein
MGAARIVTPAAARARGRGPTVRPIRVLYIANRGEIAARISRTARAMGIEAVAAVLDGAGAVNLLDPSATVAAAVAAGADALHPGYGFLAENAGFAEAVVDAGLRWVGPPAAAIRTMGDKASARRLAASLHIPTLAGYDDDDQSDAALLAAAERLGVPLLVKPSGGGGGKGMRLVRSLDALPGAIAGGRREANASFGDDRLILERFVEGPRHVEIQVLFDEHGQGVHLGERDCSLQRRHQKVLEESPSLAVDPALRDRLGAAAIRLASAVGYVSAGTVEFLLDDRGSFSFLEMNTRLQVEHPVTEAVTGRDLVADQLRIAEGRPLEIAQADMHIEGHAFEARLYAEDAEAEFLPATGRVAGLEWPAGDGIRVDAGIADGETVTDRYDPMLAKILAWGTSRDQALERLATALDQTFLLGVTTNLRFLRWVVRQPVVRAGQVRIDTLERIWPPDGWATAATVPPQMWSFAAARLASRAHDPWSGGWRLNGPPSVRVVSEGVERSVTPDERAAASAARWVEGAGIVFVDHEGRSVPFQLAPPPDVDATRASAGRAAGGWDVRAPMPGAVLQVHVSRGAGVEQGQALITLEAMKMEHVVAAPSTGTLAELLVAPGDQVTKGQLVAVLRG